MRVPFTPGTPFTAGKPLFTEVTPCIREAIITTTIITGTTEDTMAVTGTTPTRATTVDIGTAGITAAAITAPVIIPTTRRSSLDYRSRFLSPSLSRNNGSGVRSILQLLTS